MKRPRSKASKSDNESEDEHLAHERRRYRGVQRKHSGTWEARINCKRKWIYLGYYQTDSEAARAFDRAAICIRGHKSARLNFPLSHYAHEIHMLENMRQECLVQYLKNLQTCKLVAATHPSHLYMPVQQPHQPMPGVTVPPMGMALHQNLSKPQPLVGVHHHLAPSQRTVHRIESIDNMERAGIVSRMECAAFLLMHMATMKQMKQASSYENLNNIDQSANYIC